MNKRSIALLDLGGVVFQMSGVSNEHINWGLIWELNKKYGAEMDLGGTGFTDFLIEYNETTNQNLEQEMFLSYVFDTLDFNQKLIDIISEHRDIIIVSDNYRENIEYISKRYDFASWAVRQFYSYDFKCYKSDPRFFKELLVELSEYPIEEMILIDDSESKIKSAAQNGIRGILFKNNDQVKKELDTLSA